MEAEDKCNSLLVAGKPIEFRFAGGKVEIGTFDSLQCAVERLVGRPAKTMDLSIEFRHDESHLRKDAWNHWSGVEGECPYIALISYLVLVARRGNQNQQGFYACLQDARRSAHDQYVQKRAVETSELEKLPWILEKFDSWVRHHRPNLRFDPTIRYYRNATNIGRILDETILGHDDEAALQQAAFAAALSPESADLPDLASRLLARTPTSLTRLRSILKKQGEGPIMAAVRAVIRDWDGVAPEELAAEPVTSGRRVKPVRLSSVLIWDASSASNPTIRLRYSGPPVSEGILRANGKFPAVRIECNDGDCMWSTDQRDYVDVAARLLAPLSIDLGENGQTLFDPLGSGEGAVATRVYVRTIEANIYEESRGRLPAERKSSTASLVIATVSPDLIRALERTPKLQQRKLGAITLLAAPLNAEVRAVLSQHGFHSGGTIGIRLVGGVRLGRGNRFYSYLPPEVHVTGGPPVINPPDRAADWLEVEPGVYVFNSDFVRLSSSTCYEFICEDVDERRSSRFFLDSVSTMSAESLQPFRSLDSFARPAAEVSGFRVRSATALTNSALGSTVRNVLKIGQMSPHEIAHFKERVKRGSYQEGGAFLLGLLRAKGSIDDNLFRGICSSIWYSLNPDDDRSPHDAEVRRQRDSLLALGHAEYVDRRLRRVDPHAVIMPGLRKYELLPGGNAAPDSVACFIAGWTLAELAAIEAAAESPRWRDRIRVVLHKQPSGAWAIPPRLVVLGPPNRRIDDIVQFFAELEIPLCHALDFAQLALAETMPDVEPWARSDADSLRDLDVFEPERARWLKANCFSAIPFPWSNGTGLWAVRRPVEDGGRRYNHYSLVRRDATGNVAIASVSKEPHAAAAWYAWREWQQQIPGSQVLLGHANPSLTCVPHSARPPWWLERAICGHTGFAAEWLTLKQGAESSSQAGRADNVSSSPKGYPINVSNFLPNDTSPRALEVRLHGWRDLSEDEARSLLWRFEGVCNRPDLIQR
jgi:hypothetical protein